MKKNNYNYFGYIILLMLWLFSFRVSAVAYTIDSLPNPYKQSDVVYVVDPDHIISAQDKAEISRKLAVLESESSVEVVVVALPSIGTEDTRQFANELFNKWKIGRGQSDNGLLILLVVDQREVVFETGYGLEGILPDVACFRIQQRYMVPLLRNNNFSGGMLQGVIGTIEYLNSKSLQAEFTQNRATSVTMPDEFVQNHTTSVTSELELPLTVYELVPFFLMVVLIAIALIYLLPKIGKRDALSVLKKSDTWAIIIYLLIFWVIPSFLIFLIFYKVFYRPKLVKRTIICPQCQANHYRVLPDAQAVAYLSKQALFEKKIGAAKHTVYQCLDCNNIYSMAWPTKKYTPCPKCHVKAFGLKKTTVVKSPTYTSTGIMRKISSCEYCGYTSQEDSVISRKTRSSSGGSSRGGGGSFGGGSFGGGGGSRGGGSSGGGGSRSSF